jgi:hypothetical protein
VGYICRTRGLAAEPTLELLINNPLESRVPVAPALTKRASRPLVGNYTLRGSSFSSLGLGPCGGHPYSVRDQAVLMPTVVAAVVRRGRAFSGDATARVVGDVGGGRDEPPQLFDCRAVMIAHPVVLATWGPLVSGRCGYLQLMCTAHTRGSVSTAPLDL